MAGPAIRIPVELDLSRAEKALKRGVGDRVVKIRLDPKDFNQPLGRITGKLGEFDNALAASNARVIAFGASASAIYAIQKALSSTVKSAIEVEKVLADINVILNASGSNLKKFGDELFKIAGNTGQSFNEVAKAATELARQGLSVSETLRRTNDALVLTRLSGLGATQSVESLTAAINSFNKTAITSTEIVNKLANVDAAFAVSSKDLAEAIRRVGSTANDANVSFDELIAAVTSAQQVTARGGAVIGNSFKTIFTRLQRPKVLDALEELGVKTRSITGDTRPAIKILKEFSQMYEGLAPSIKATTSELIGGVFQINIVKAALSDLNKEYSIFDQALRTSITSTDEAIQRNEALNQTMSAMINKTFANLQKVAAGAGEDMFGPMMKSLIGKLNGALEALGSDPETKGVGSKIASGIFKGIGDFLSGPGLLIGAVGLFKIVSRISATASDALQSIVLTSKKQEHIKGVKMAAFNILQKEPALLEKVLNNTMTIEQAHEKVLDTIEAETNALRLQMNLAGELAKKLSAAGVVVPESGPFTGKLTTPRDGGAKRAGGHKPDWLGETSAMANSGYSLSDMRDPGVRSQKIHDGRGGSFMASVNKHETVKTMKGPGGKKGTFVIPPSDSDAFRGLKAGGFTPNFANTLIKKTGKGFDFSGTLGGLVKDLGGSTGGTLQKVINRWRDTHGFGEVENDDKFLSSTQVRRYNVGKSKDRNETGAILERRMANSMAKVGGMRAGMANSTPARLAKLTKAAGIKGTPIEGLTAQQALAIENRSPDIKKGQLSMGSFKSDKSSADFLFDSGGKYTSGEAKNLSDLSNPLIFLKATVRKHMMDLLSRGAIISQFGEGVKKKQDEINLGTQILGTNTSTKLFGNHLGQKKAKGFVPNFATGIYDSDYIPGSRTGKQAILQAITGSGKPIKTIMGASGSGKSTFSAGMGKRITSMKQVGKFDDYVVVYGGGKSSKGGLTTQGQQVFGATTGGVTAVAPSNQEIYSRRIGRLNKARHKGVPDQRSYKGLMGAMKAPYNQYDYMAQVKKMMKGRGQSFNVARAGGFIPNFASSSEALSIFNTKGKQVNASKVAHDWREMSSDDFKGTYGSKHAGERSAAAEAGVPWSKWKQGKNRASKQAEITRINSPHVMLTSDIGLKNSSMTVDKRVNDKKYKVTFPYGGLKKSPIGASNFKDLIDQELSGGMTNIYNRLGFKDLETSLGSKQRPEFSRVMKQSNVDQSLGNMFDGLVKKMIRGSSKLIDEDLANVNWDVPSTSGAIQKAFHTKGGLKGDLKLSAGKEGPSDFAEKVLYDKGIKRTRPKAGGFFPSFAKGIQKAVVAEQMFGGKGAKPVLDFSSELQGKGMSGLFVRDKKQKGIGGVKRDHGGLTRALKDSKSMQRGMAKGFIPNFAKDDISDMGGGGARWMMASFMAPMIAQTMGEIMPATKNVATALGQGASMFGTIFSMLPGPWGKAIGAVVGVGTAITSFAKAYASKSAEFSEAAGRANEKLTEFQNGMQGYLTALEAFTNATKDSEKSSAEIARIHSNMAESLSMIDSQYQAQLLAAKDITEAQKIQADIAKQMKKEAGQVSFAAEIQKQFDEQFDTFSLTEIFDKGGNLGKISSGLVKSIGVDTLGKTSNLDQLLSGSQQEVLNKLQGEFKLDPLLVESLSDLTSATSGSTNEFQALMEELKMSKMVIDDTTALLDRTTELRKVENERLKEFQEEAAKADKTFTDFVNALRQTGDTLSKTLQGTMNLREGAKAGTRKGAFERGKSGLNLAKGTIGDNAFLDGMARLESANRSGKKSGAANKLLQGSNAEQVTAIREAFLKTLDAADKGAVAKGGRNINKINAERQANFFKSQAAATRKIAALDPSTQGGAIQKVINDLAAGAAGDEKQSALLAKLNDIQVDASNKLGKIEQDAVIANASASQQLNEQKKANNLNRQARRLGGVAGFMDPTSTLKPHMDKMNRGMGLMRQGGKVRGGLGTIARGRGAMDVAMAGKALGVLNPADPDKPGSGAALKALTAQAIPAKMKQDRMILARMRQGFLAQQRGASARGDQASARSHGLAAAEIGSQMTPENLRAGAKRSIEMELKTGDLKTVNFNLMESIKAMNETFKGAALDKVLGENLKNILDGTNLAESVKKTDKLSQSVIDSATALAKSNETLGEQQEKSSNTIKDALDAFIKSQNESKLAEAEERVRGGVGTGEFINRNTDLFRDDPTQGQFIDELSRITTTLAEDGVKVDSLSEMRSEASKAGIELSGFTEALPGGTQAVNQFIKALSESDFIKPRAHTGSYSQPTANAAGYVPNFNKVLGYGAERERRMAAMGGYAAGGVTSMMIGGKKRIYNRAEQVKQFPGMEPAIMPPSGSRAGRNYKSKFGKTHGFNPYSASGYVPNFAQDRKRIVGAYGAAGVATAAGVGGVRYGMGRAAYGGGFKQFSLDRQQKLRETRHYSGGRAQLTDKQAFNALRNKYGIDKLKAWGSGAKGMPARVRSLFARMTDEGLSIPTREHWGGWGKGIRTGGMNVGRKIAPFLDPRPVAGGAHPSTYSGIPTPSPKVNASSPLKFNSQSSHGGYQSTGQRYTFGDKLQSDMATDATGKTRAGLSQRGHSLFGPSKIKGTPGRFGRGGFNPQMTGGFGKNLLKPALKSAGKGLAVGVAGHMALDAAGIGSAGSADGGAGDMAARGGVDMLAVLAAGGGPASLAVAGTYGLAAAARDTVGYTGKLADQYNFGGERRRSNKGGRLAHLQSGYLKGKSPNVAFVKQFEARQKAQGGLGTIKSVAELESGMWSGGKYAGANPSKQLNKNAEYLKKNRSRYNTLIDPAKYQAGMDARNKAHERKMNEAGLRRDQDTRLAEANRGFPATDAKLSFGERMKSDPNGGTYLPSVRKKFEEEQAHIKAQGELAARRKEERRSKNRLREESRKAQEQLDLSRTRRAEIMNAPLRPDLLNPRDARKLSDSYLAGGYVPNFQGINDAVRREIRDGGVSSGQVRVHLNPDAVTNTRDEPRGLKDVPNFAGGEGLKEMLSILKELLQETREKNQIGSATERKAGDGESVSGTVRHDISPLNINVSGSIQETSSNIDEEIFAAVVKAVEKLRGGMPVAPPKGSNLPNTGAPKNRVGGGAF